MVRIDRKLANEKQSLGHLWSLGHLLSLSHLWFMERGKMKLEKLHVYQTLYQNYRENPKNE